ncbi:MAG: hypothetical protein JWQ22_3300 [Devosia sp.]|nr:hypothetical protein [Devosia sp.]
MVTLLLVSAFMLALCTAAAGLIASAQNNADANEAALSDNVGADLQV